MIIGFTGHRDRITTLLELAEIYVQFPDAQWVHGDARFGFDAQVKAFAEQHGISVKGYPPDYQKYIKVPKYAPIARNHEKIVDPCDILVACYDGRKKGGTFDTVNYALKLNKPVIYLSAIELIKE